MLRLILALACFVCSTYAACDNHCSGHGTCGVDDVCTCYDNWGIGQSHDSGDCSERVCPYELAWVDTPDKTGKFHKYSECAGRGVCDRATGECQCFDGYEGKGCARTSCPNDCSGHGTCEYIDDFFFGATWGDYSKKRFMSDPASFDFAEWDAGKTRGCICDSLYGDVDCSKRMCPYGNDVLDIIDNYGGSTAYQVQTLRFFFQQAVDPKAHTSNNAFGKTFALTFKSKLNETFTTIPIVFDAGDATDATAALNDFTQDVQLALLNLPNRVIDGVTVSAANSASSVTGIANSGGYLDMLITFTGASVQGNQHPLTVEDYECSAGCTPRITGLPLEYRIDGASSNYTQSTAADYNSFECGRRGKCDYDTGVCECFTGYIGDNCNTLTTLV
jgi:hypothetical protein